MLKKQQVVELVKGMMQTQIDERTSYLRRLCGYLTPKVRDLVRNHLDEAADEDRRQVTEYDENNKEIERIGDFVDISPQLKFWGRIFNMLLFGKFGNILLREIDQYAERCVAWRTLEQVADKMYRTFKEDATYLADGEDLDLSRRLDEVALFYGNLSLEAAYGCARMNKLLQRAISLYGSMTKLKAPNVEGISSDVLDKISKVHVIMEPSFSKA